MPEDRHEWLIHLFENGEHVTRADAALQDRQIWFDALVKEKALVHSGNVSSLLCPQCDEPHDIPVHPTTFKGYCVDAGHVSFDAKQVMQYQASQAWLIEAARKSLGVAANEKIKDVVVDTCWKIGSARLAKKLRPIYLCRGYASSKQVVDNGIAALADDTGMILLTSPHRQNPEKIAAHRAVSMAACLGDKPDKSLLSADVLERMWNNQPAQNGQLTHSADYRTVTLNGTTHHFPGDLQRAFVRHLIELYRKGQMSAKTSEVMSAIGVEGTRRIANLFNGHQTWESLIGYGNPRGTCRLLVN
ncbi:MAG: hypothetical protein IPI58_06045 [Alphaproteobacteria bacterium]|nr:MAG: hypothetical protein IPI58_06045 [Alphaproteobacteria bacterium]